MKNSRSVLLGDSNHSRSGSQIEKGEVQTLFNNWRNHPYTKLVNINVCILILVRIRPSISFSAFGWMDRVAYRRALGLGSEHVTRRISLCDNLVSFCDNLYTVILSQYFAFVDAPYIVLFCSCIPAYLYCLFVYIFEFYRLKGLVPERIISISLFPSPPSLSLHFFFSRTVWAKAQLHHVRGCLRQWQ